MNEATRQKGPLRRLFGRIAAVFSFLYRALFILSLLFGAFLGWMLLSGGPSVQVEDNVGLVIAPTGALVEHVDADPVQQLMQRWTGEPPLQTSVASVVDAFDRARADDRIAFAVLKLDELRQAGLASIDEVARAAERFRASGKKIYVWADMLTQPQYALAAQADEIALDPFGGIWVEGYSVYPNYFAELLDRLGITVSVFRVGEYKSAVEPFIRNDMSDAARDANAAWLDDLWTAYLERASAVRETVGETLPAMLSDLPARLEAAGGDLAATVAEAGIVDRLESLQDFRERMGEVVGMAENGHGSFRQIHFRHYLRATDEQAAAASTGSRIAKIHVQGVIVDGFGEPGTAGGDAIADQLLRASRDDKVRAVILRVDTPGGSVLASERIRRAVLEVQEAGKPVVASMASQAASGGYWVSMDADDIVAYDATITGSIGVFGLWMSVDQGLEKIGVHTDGIGTTPLAGKLRPDQPLDENLERVFQSGVEHAYASFVERVAAGRELPIETVRDIAEGRVWSGTQALERGLVDRLGGLDLAIDRAAELAGLTEGEYRVTTPATPQPRLMDALQFWSGRAYAALSGTGMDAWLAGWARSHLQGRAQAASLALIPADPRGLYALCDCQLDHGAAGLPRTSLPGAAR
ncbi:signal peptide peptidase SppA [Algiphilus sp.]|uniref:signal peptide peptidase SppA n=1 Tax=Algiphilus sp. TaxID=1872431 RepID=UPI003B52ED09